jgi:uncharacterized membrane protein YgcG
MKFIVLIGAVALAATAFTPLAHASAALSGLDKQCYNTLRKEWSGCNKGSGADNKNLPDFKFNMKSHGKPGKPGGNGGNGNGNGGNNGGGDNGNGGDNGGDNG